MRDISLFICSVSFIMNVKHLPFMHPAVNLENKCCRPLVGHPDYVVRARRELFRTNKREWIKEWIKIWQCKIKIWKFHRSSGSLISLWFYLISSEPRTFIRDEIIMRYNDRHDEYIESLYRILYIRDTRNNGDDKKYVGALICSGNIRSLTVDLMNYK